MFGIPDCKSQSLIARAVRLPSRSSAIRPDCVVIPKGQIYEMKMFGPKDSRFKSRAFVGEVKHFYTDLINSMVPEERKRLSMFELGEPYLAARKIGKNNPLVAEIAADNEARMEWSRAVNEAVVAGISEEEIVQLKKDEISGPIKQAVSESGQEPIKLRGISKKVVQTLIAKIRRLVAPVRNEIVVDLQAFEEMKTLRKRMEVDQKQLRFIDQRIEIREKKLETFNGLAGLTHRK